MAKKYLFGLMVAVYMITAIGIPVYLHYCGGELEKITFLVKSNSCCGGEEEEDMDGGCCANENTVARYSPDFTVKKIVDSNFSIVNFELFTSVPILFDVNIERVSFQVSKYFFPPPDIVQNNIVATTSLRI